MDQGTKVSWILWPENPYPCAKTPFFHPKISWTGLETLFSCKNMLSHMSQSENPFSCAEPFPSDENLLDAIRNPFLPHNLAAQKPLSLCRIYLMESGNPFLSYKNLLDLIRNPFSRAKHALLYVSLNITRNPFSCAEPSPSYKNLLHMVRNPFLPYNLIA